MSTPQRLANAVENYFGPHDPEVKAEILAALDAHFRSPWIFNQDAQPDVGVEVICLDPDEQGRPAGPVTICARSPEDDWTLPEFVFWWMHVPPLPEDGLLRAQESPENRVDAGLGGGTQTLAAGALMGWDVHHAALADVYAESEAAVSDLRARCAPHGVIQAAESAAEAARAELLEHARAILALHNQNTNKEADHVV